MKTIANLVLALVLLSSFVYAIDDLMSIQGNVDDDYEPMTNGNIRFFIYDEATGGNLLFDSGTTYDGSIVNGVFDVTLGESNDLSLQYGRIYYFDLTINGNDMDFGSDERQAFMSSIGDVFNLTMNVTGDLNVFQHQVIHGNLTVGVNGNITASLWVGGDLYVGGNITGDINWSNIYDEPEGIGDGDSVNNYEYHVTVAKTGGVFNDMWKGNYSSIQHAIDNITDSSSTRPYVITVYPGVYNENVLLDKDYITLISAGEHAAIIEGNADTAALSITGANNVVSGFTIIGKQSGGSSPYAFGVSISNTNDVVLINNMVNSTTGTSTGVVVDTSQKVKLVDNQIWGSAYGVYLTTVDEIRIEGNQIHSSASSGIYSTGSSNVVVQSNEIDSTSSFGLYFTSTTGSLIQANTISSSGYGLYFLTAHNNVIQSNLIESTTNEGLNIDGSSANIIQGNRILATATDKNAVNLLAASNLNRLSQNVINSSDGHGVHIDTSAGTVNYLSFNEVHGGADATDSAVNLNDADVDAYLNFDVLTAEGTYAIGSAGTGSPDAFLSSVAMDKPIEADITLNDAHDMVSSGSMAIGNAVAPPGQGHLNVSGNLYILGDLDVEGVIFGHGNIQVDENITADRLSLNAALADALGSLNSTDGVYTATLTDGAQAGFFKDATNSVVLTDGTWAGRFYGDVDVDGDVDIDGPTFDLLASAASASAVKIATSDAAGGVDIDSGTGGVAVDTTGAVSIDADTASNFNAAAGDLTVEAETGSVIIKGDEAVSDAVLIDADDAAGTGATINVGQTGGLLISGGLTDIGGGSKDHVVDDNDLLVAGSVEIDGNLWVDGDFDIDGVIFSHGGVTIDENLTAARIGVNSSVLDQLGSLVATDGTRTVQLADGTWAASLTGPLNVDGSVDVDGTTFDADMTGAISLDADLASNFNTAAGDLTLDAETGSVNVDGGEAAADAVRIVASDAAGGLDVDSGTGGVDIDTTGIVDIDSSFGNVGAIHLDASAIAGGIDVDTGLNGFDLDSDGIIDLNSYLSDPGAVHINASYDAGGLDVDTGTGGVDVDTTGKVTFDGGDVGVNVGGAPEADLEVGDGSMTHIDGSGGDVLVADDVEIDGDLYVDGNVDIDGIVFTHGSLEIDENITADRLALNSSLPGLMGSANMSGSLFVGTDALIDNVQIGESGATEIDTLSGNLVLDSQGGTVQVTDSVDVDGVTLDADMTGAISLDADLASNFNTAAGDITVDAESGSVNVDGGEAVADAVRIVASDAAGGVDLDSGTGGVAVDTTGAVSIDADTASNFNTAAGDLTVEAETGSVVIKGDEAVSDAVLIDADDAAGTGATINIGSSSALLVSGGLTED